MHVYSVIILKVRDYLDISIQFLSILSHLRKGMIWFGQTEDLWLYFFKKLFQNSKMGKLYEGIGGHQTIILQLEHQLQFSVKKTAPLYCSC